jgi:hypothetical protein
MLAKIRRILDFNMTSMYFRFLLFTAQYSEVIHIRVPCNLETYGNIEELNSSAVIELVEQNQFGHRTTEIQIYGH